MPFYLNKQRQKVFLINSRPRNLSAGGLIKSSSAIPRHHLDEDTIMARMEVGSLVVPRPVAWMMKYYPHKYTQTKKPIGDLEPVVVMPNEITVPKEFAKQVEDWLLQHGISLPTPADWDVKKKMMIRNKCNNFDCKLCSYRRVKK